MTGSIDLTTPVTLAAPRTPAERARARLTAARYAHNATDLRHLLDVLDLWPASDNHHPRLGEVPTPFTGGRPQHS